MALFQKSCLKETCSLTFWPCSSRPSYLWWSFMCPRPFSSFTFSSLEIIFSYPHGLMFKLKMFLSQACHSPTLLSLLLHNTHSKNCLWGCVINVQGGVWVWMVRFLIFTFTSYVSVHKFLIFFALQVTHLEDVNNKITPSQDCCNHLIHKNCFKQCQVHDICSITLRPHWTLQSVELTLLTLHYLPLKCPCFLP